MSSMLPDDRNQNRGPRWKGWAVSLACFGLAVAMDCDPSGGNRAGSVRPLVFGAAMVYGNVPSGLVAVGDLNGDGKADIAISSVSELSIIMNRGDGTFADPVTYVAPRQPTALAIGDLNGDGVPDLALGDSGTPAPASEASPGQLGGVTVFMNDGSGLFAS